MTRAVPKLFRPARFTLIVSSLNASPRAELHWFGDPAKDRAVVDHLNFESAEEHRPDSPTLPR